MDHLRLKEKLHACAAAFQFLTRLPIPVQLIYTDRVFQGSVVYYPLVGGVIGGILALAGWGLAVLLPVFPAAVLLLVLWVALSGALHMDGLMDTADGVLSHRPRERMLEIMKDSRVGAMGVIVCVLYLLLKLSFIVTLLNGYGPFTAGLLACTPVWSRWFMAVAIAVWPYARKDSGLGSYYRGVGLTHATASFAFAVTVSYIMLWFGGIGNPPDITDGFGQFGIAVVIIVSFASVTLLIGWWTASSLSRKLGGLTGDTYGALNEILELILLLMVIIGLRLG